jgi:hypothetical protein
VNIKPHVWAVLVVVSGAAWLLIWAGFAFILA